MTYISKTDEWKQLEKAAMRLLKTTMRALFAEDADRFGRFSIEAAGVFLDFSKNKIDQETMDALMALGEAAKIETARKRMLAGEEINASEGRAVLHMALRDFSMRAYHVGGENISPAVRAELEKVKAFTDKIHKGALKGYAGDAFDTVVNIGIGGSDLGPKMVTEALRPYWITGRRTFFVSNVDGQHLADTLAQIDPATTLFIIASKTFTTQETMTNAQSAKAWFLDNGGGQEAIAKHFIALSTNEQAVAAFGISPENMFVFWDWVGGRFSLWSAIGMSIALQVGYGNFDKLLRGAHAMDEHFRDAPLEENMPVLLALVGVWNRNFLGARAHAVLPYDEHLKFLPAYLQQVDMESNGKARRQNGEAVRYATGPMIFGAPGTNGQHAFYQSLHQGTDVISSDFIAPGLSHAPLGDHHEKLLSNFLAQTQALMRGRTEEEARAELAVEGRPQDEIDALSPHKVFPGDRPANSILFEKLTPETLGALIALYEHKIFCQSVIWDINAFDQWGVELGKALAATILPEIAKAGEEKPEAASHDGSTNGLLNRINTIRANAKVE